MHEVPEGAKNAGKPSYWYHIPRYCKEYTYENIIQWWHNLNLSFTGVGLKSDTVGGLGGHPPSLNEADLTDAMVKMVKMANLIIVNTLSMAECNFLFDVKYLLYTL